MSLFTDNEAALVVSVIVAVHSSASTMKAARVERGVASAAYSFVRFSGGAVAPWLAGILDERVSAIAVGYDS